MKKMYLAGMAIIFLLILILSLPQLAATCSWISPLDTSAGAAFVLMQAAGLGAIFGGLAVLYWKAMMAPVEDDSASMDNITPKDSKPPQKMS
ncbi:hypothetical protein HZA44_01255 [Candidatus Peregrinibacteria bacterium]|nr:hypothetical protein [Candidatus Peregrinibacteria bacterium]